jgi:hypothetical protein
MEYAVDMQRIFNKVVQNIKEANNNKKVSHHCAACGKLLSRENLEKQRASCYNTYGKPDVWLCWSCNYDYKKFAQDSRVETFYRIMKGE